MNDCQKCQFDGGRLVWGEALSKAYQVFRLYSDDPSARAINVGYEKERDGHGERYNYKQRASSVCAIAN